MKHLKSVALVLVATGVWSGCGGGEALQEDSEWTMDPRSYSLGAIAAFAEMVDFGVKKLALSSPLDSADMDLLLPEAERIASSQGEGVGIFRESDFLVTDLFSEALTDGKDVLLICSEATRLEYTELKALKSRLMESGQYDAEARVDIARRFGELLSYPEEAINAMLASRSGS